jgi:preprotein translocase subunit SecG
MSTALIIALAAVAISLFVVVLASRGKSKARNDGDGGTSYVGSDTGIDCSTSDGGSCDGGGGGD